ncbi:MAG: murein biosynthesis integral membrane protein MurJ [Xanthomonadaceae bacterium]|nr:murein biosynthesis integral membrane protein MurJ [Xanthomonadaceae bacterium]
MSRGGGLFRSTAVFGAMTLLSRLAGFARDVIQARLFGAGSLVDAFTVAYQVPNYLRRIFAEGSFASAFVPVLSELRQKGDAAALKSFVDHVAGALCAVLLVVTGLGMLAAPWIATLMAPGFAAEPGKLELTTEMLRIVFPYIFFISMTALAGGVLNSFQRFALPALTPVLHNLTLIAAMLWLASRLDRPIMALAWGVLAAGALQMALLWPALRRYGLFPRLRLDFRHPGVRRVFSLMLPTLFSSSVAQLNLIVGTIFASLLAEGSRAYLYYSDRLVELPLGLFGVALGTVILPHLSRRHADTDAAGFSASLDWGLRTVLLGAVPAALGLLFLAEPLVATIYQRGEFSAEAARMTAMSLSAMSLAIPAFMLSKVLAPAFYSRQDTKTPMRAAIITVVLNISLMTAIVTPLWRYGVYGAHAGIALATALAGIGNAFLLWRYLRRDGVWTAAPGWGRVLLRIAVAGVAMVAVLIALRIGPWDWRALHGTTRWLWLALVIAAGAGTYAVALLAFGWRPRELRHSD